MDYLTNEEFHRYAGSVATTELEKMLVKRMADLLHCEDIVDAIDDRFPWDTSDLSIFIKDVEAHQDCVAEKDALIIELTEGELA